MLGSTAKSVRCTTAGAWSILQSKSRASSVWHGETLIQRAGCEARKSGSVRGAAGQPAVPTRPGVQRQTKPSRPIRPARRAQTRRWSLMPSVAPSPLSTNCEFLAEADAAAAQPGAIGALQRREGRYCSHLVTWRRERQAGILKGLTPHKRGPKSKRNPQEEEMQKLRRENQHLTEELRKAAIVIDIQKKVGALLGWPLPKADPEEQP